MDHEITLNSFDENLLQSLGIVDFGVTYDATTTSFDKYQAWVERGDAAYLNYLKDERLGKRQTLLEIFPEFQTALVFLFAYDKHPAGNNKYKLADYVQSFSDTDYHQVIPQKIQKLMDSQFNDRDLKFKIIVDTAPVMERDLAYRSGLGWFGKNSMLINKKFGSYFLIGSVLLNKKITFKDTKNNSMEIDHCGTCTRCIEACPTQAIDEVHRQIKVEKCISSYTIELFKYEKVAPLGYEKSHELFGCDICQSVCPWNNKIKMTENAQTSQLSDFFLSRPLEVVHQDLKAMSKREFRKKFRSTPLERTGRDSLLKNIESFLKI